MQFDIIEVKCDTVIYRFYNYFIQFSITMSYIFLFSAEIGCPSMSADTDADTDITNFKTADMDADTGIIKFWIADTDANTDIKKLIASFQDYS